MENNDKPRQETQNGEHRPPKKPYHKHHKRGYNHKNHQNAPAEGKDNMSVRPAHHDAPQGESAEAQNRGERAEHGNGQGGHSNHHHHHRHRNDRRRNHPPKPQADTPELTVNAEDALAKAIDEITAHTEESPAETVERSEYITTAGSLDLEIVDEINSVSDSEIELIESSEDVEIPAELATYEVVGIRFKTGGKIYYFEPGELKTAKNQPVIVETSRGLEFGVCEIPNKTVTEREVVLPLRPVVRIATAEDETRHAANVVKEKEAFSICSQKILDHKLGMKLIDVEYAFDGSKLLFYFTAEGRVDFRELVKDLAAVFRTRIELRQIGIRDETKLLGGIGICGRPFCCKTFLPDFVQVSIKMAKEQNLSLNSVKISGACGRLMCCLRYEYDTYQEEIKKTPRVDQIVSTPDGDGTVIEVQPLAGLIRVRFGSKADMIPPKVFLRDDVTVIGGKGVKPKDPVSE